MRVANQAMACTAVGDHLKMFPVRPVHWRWIIALVMAGGIVLRMGQYLANRSLWVDEVFLAKNIVEKSFDALWGPLDYSQGAPIGFLFLERMAVLLWGANEYALRLIPLSSGIVAMFLFYGLAKDFLGEGAKVLALLFFAVSDPLIYYASEAKQYSSDVMIGLFIVYVAQRVHRFGLSRLNLFLLFICAGAVWFSDSSVFVLATAASSFLFSSSRDRAKWLPLLGVISFWLLSFAANYFLHLRFLIANSALGGYWSNYFVPFPPTSIGDLKGIGAAILGAVEFLFHSSPSGLIIFAIVIGCLAISKHTLWLLISPLVFALAASAFRQYPFYERFLLFSLPHLILLAVFGTASLFESLSSQEKSVAAAHSPSMTANAKIRPASFQTRFHGSNLVQFILLGLIIVPPVLSASYLFVKPRLREEIKPVIEYYLQHRLPNDGLYVYYAAEAPFDYYRRQFGQDAYPLIGIPSRDHWIQYFHDLNRLRGYGRVWVLFSHVTRDQGVDEEKLYIEYLDQIGRRLDSFQRYGAAVYLYELNYGTEMSQ